MEDKQYCWIDYNTIEIVIRPNQDKPYSFYRVDIEAWTSPEKLIDWILQVAHKGWCTPELLAAYLRIMEKAIQWHFGQDIYAQFIYHKTKRK